MALVEVRSLVKQFVRQHGMFREATIVTAVDDVSFSIEEGETSVSYTHLTLPTSYSV